MKVICAFSSDSRELYKADIYRALALPEGHILHFRYERKYVDDDLLERLTAEGIQRIAIFYTHGNQPDGHHNKLIHTSIRWAQLVGCPELSEDTDVFHVYMKLGGFCDLTIDSSNVSEKQPPTNFFSILDCSELNDAETWHSRVERIKDFFPNISFFQLKGIYKAKIVGSDKKQNLKYKNNEKSCHYDLHQGKNYLLKLSLGNPNVNADSKINVTYSSELITLNCISPLETSVEYDDLEILASIKILQSFSQTDLIKFKPIVGDRDGGYNEFATSVEINLKNERVVANKVWGY